jgi:hypothetical protein
MNKGESMKSFITLTFGFLLLFCCAVKAQQTLQLQEPEYNYVYQYLDTSNAPPSMERQAPNITFKTKFLGYGGARSMYEINGKKSLIRFRNDQKIEIIARRIPPSTDPAMVIKFFRFEEKKAKRELLIAKVGLMGLGSASINPEQGEFPFNTSKYDNYSLEVVPAQSRAPGEYGISSALSSHVFCFGVDPSDKR